MPDWIIANDDPKIIGALIELEYKHQAAIKCFKELQAKGILLPAK